MVFFHTLGPGPGIRPPDSRICPRPGGPRPPCGFQVRYHPMLRNSASGPTTNETFFWRSCTSGVFFERGSKLGDFEGLGGPGGPGDPSTRRGASPPTVCKGLRGPRGRPDPQNDPFLILYKFRNFISNGFVWGLPGRPDLKKASQKSGHTASSYPAFSRSSASHSAARALTCTQSQKSTQFFGGHTQGYRAPGVVQNRDLSYGSSHRPCKPYEFIGFGGIHGPKPCEFKGFWAMHVTKPYEFIFTDKQ
jgi:hypothetical protein